MSNFTASPVTSQPNTPPSPLIARPKRRATGPLFPAIAPRDPVRVVHDPAALREYSQYHLALAESLTLPSHVLARRFDLAADRLRDDLPDDERITIEARLTAFADELHARFTVYIADAGSNPFANLTDDAGPLPAREREAEVRVALRRSTKVNIALGAEVAYRELGSLALTETIEALTFAAAEPFDDVDAYITGERLRVAQAEMACRERLHATGHRVPNPRNPGPWKDLVAAVKRDVPILAVLERGGYPFHDMGRAEGHGPCIDCGGWLCPKITPTARPLGQAPFLPRKSVRSPTRRSTG